MNPLRRLALWAKTRWRHRDSTECDCYCHREMDVVLACGDCGYGEELSIADFESGGAR